MAYSQKRVDENHSFNIHVAEKVGIEKALLLKEIYGWVQHNSQRGINEINGEHYTVLTGKQLGKKFPYLETKSIYRWLKKLEEDGWVHSIKPKLAYKGNQSKGYFINSERYDMAVMYREVANSQIENWSKYIKSISQNENCISQNENCHSISQNEKCYIYNSGINSEKKELGKEPRPVSTFFSGENPSNANPPAPPAPQPEVEIDVAGEATKDRVRAYLRGKRKSLAKLLDGVDMDVPTLIDSIANYWVDAECRRFITGNRADQKGVDTATQLWVKNLVERGQTTQAKESKEAAEEKTEKVIDLFVAAGGRKVNEKMKPKLVWRIKELFKNGEDLTSIQRAFAQISRLGSVWRDFEYTLEYYHRLQKKVAQRA